MPTASYTPDGGKNKFQQLQNLRFQIIQDPELTKAELKVALVLAEHFNMQQQLSWPSQQGIAEKTGYNVRTVQKALKQLVDRGRIKIVANGRVNSYRFLEYTPPVAAEYTPPVAGHTRPQGAGDTRPTGGALTVKELEKNYNPNGVGTSPPEDIKVNQEKSVVELDLEKQVRQHVAACWLEINRAWPGRLASSVEANRVLGLAANKCGLEVLKDIRSFVFDASHLADTKPDFKPEKLKDLTSYLWDFHRGQTPEIKFRVFRNDTLPVPTYLKKEPKPKPTQPPEPKQEKITWFEVDQWA